jgi:hypothetical protein
MINYTTFDTNEKFVEWQKIEERKIQTISPIMSEINLDISESDDSEGKSADGKGKTNIGIFVVYFTDDD